MAETQTTIVRMESFPFDSSVDGYDSDGYPVYDRAVGATLLRTVFARFFTDGVFGTPSDALHITRADSGLVANINPGIFIINGAMGGIYGNEPMSFTLDAAAPQGNIAYGIMLRYNESNDVSDEDNVGRSLSIRVVRGEAASNPVPPTPDKTTPGVMEYRLGYVVVPSGATDLSNATVHNEKGTATCPYTNPFNKVDLSSVVDDAQDSADRALRRYLDYVKEYYELVESSLDETTAGQLQQAIDDLEAATLNLSTIDPAFLAMQDLDTDDINLLGLVEDSVGSRELKDNAVGESNIIDLSVTDNKLSYKIQQLLGIFDADGWGYDQMYDYITSDINDDMKNGFVTDFVTSTVIAGWSTTQLEQFMDACPTNAQRTIITRLDLEDYTFAQIVEISGHASSSALSGFVGKSKNANMGSYGSSVPCVIIGVNHDAKVSGGKAKLTFEANQIMARTIYTSSAFNAGPYTSSGPYSKCSDIYDQMGSDLKSAIVQVNKPSPIDGDSGYVLEVGNTPCSVFILSKDEYGGGASPLPIGSAYDYYSNGYAGKLDSRNDVSGQTRQGALWCRSGYSRSEVDVVSYIKTKGSTGGSFRTPGASGNSGGVETGICPAFCIG